MEESKMAGPVIPDRYREAMGDDDPYLAMFEAPQKLRKLLKGLTEKQLSRRPAPGKWSIKEIVAHLADGEVILGSRYRFIAAHDKPAIAGYDQDLFVEMLGVENATTEDLLDDFEMARMVNVGLLTRLPDEAFGRVGVHSERGEETIDTIVMLYAGHDRVHLTQVETIRTGLFPPKKAGAKKKGSKTAAKVPARKAAARPAPKAAKGSGKAAKAPAKKNPKNPKKR
ncbi:MAG: DinB family protein [Holophagales bacterium]|nr:DinB family protein [Holophagales bacterium]